jgi:2-succinyl-6-hydroxy-2,4-cyclohexadiene-1-carboxylate synthase
VQRRDGCLIFLHGFLGSSEDWNEVICHLPTYRCLALSYPFHMDIPPNSTVVGYSMGGRMALRYPHRKILISAHPGLTSAVEKRKRLKIDQQWKTLLETDFTLFLKHWYDQPLFDSFREHPLFAQYFSRRLQQNPQELMEILSKESLAHQTFSLPLNADFIHGEKDLAYAALYRKLSIRSIEVPRAGHVVHLENPQACADAIRHILMQKSTQLNPNATLIASSTSFITSKSR